MEKTPLKAQIENHGNRVVVFPCDKHLLKYAACFKPLKKLKKKDGR